MQKTKSPFRVELSLKGEATHRNECPVSRLQREEREAAPSGVVCELCKLLLSSVLIHEVGLTRNIPLGQGIKLPRQALLRRDPVSITIINRSIYFAWVRETTSSETSFLSDYEGAANRNAMALAIVGHCFGYLRWLVQEWARDRILASQRPVCSKNRWP